MSELSEFVGKGLLCGLLVGSPEDEVLAVAGSLGERAIRSTSNEYIARFGAVQISFKSGVVSLIQIKPELNFGGTPRKFSGAASELLDINTMPDLVEVFSESGVDWWVDGPSCVGRVVCLRTDKARAFFNLDRNGIQSVLTA